MATPEDLNGFLSKLYTALNTGDIDTWVSLHSESAVFNITGDTIISGRVTIQRLLSDVFPLVFGELIPETTRFGLRWELMCADDRRATVIFEGESTTTEGKAYNNRYVQILEFDESDLISKVWEYFDTQLANDLLFNNPEISSLKLPSFQYRQN